MSGRQRDPREGALAAARRSHVQGYSTPQLNAGSVDGKQAVRHIERSENGEDIRRFRGGPEADLGHRPMVLATFPEERKEQPGQLVRVAVFDPADAKAHAVLLNA